MKTKKQLEEINTIGIIEKIKSKKANDFDVQELVKFLAYNIQKITVGEELMAKEYIRKGAAQLGIDMKDIQDVYQSFRKEIKQ